MDKLKWSSFSRWYRGKECDCIYNSLDASYVLLPTRVESFVPGADFVPCGLSINTVNELIAKHILCEKDKSENDIFVSLARKTCRISTLNLLVTENCNLTCSYCQITKNTTSIKSMSVDVATKMLEYFFSNNKEDDLTINITGGEPLLNWSTVRHIIEYCKPYLSRCRIVMFTNAMLMTFEKAEFLSKNNVFVIVSFDGPQFVHDQNRRNGESGSYEQANIGYNLVKKAGCKCAISAVANEYSLLNTDEFAKWVISMEPDSLGYNYPHLLLNSELNEFDFNQYANAVLYLHQEMSNHNIYFENFERFKKIISKKEMRLSECQACGKGMTVRPDGIVGPCKSLLVSNIEIATLNEYDFKKNTKLRKWLERKTINSEKCRACRALSICGGGCAYDTYIINNGDISVMDYRMCDYVKMVFDRILEDICNGKTEVYNREIRSVGH